MSFDPNFLGFFCVTIGVTKMFFLSYDVASEREITPCIKVDKPLVVYRFSGNVMK